MKDTILIDKKFLKEIMETVSPSGSEQDIINILSNNAKKITKNVYIDTMGSLHAIINPEAKRKVVLVGHCDEIGLIIKTITPNGFLKVGPIGGWDPNVIVGQRVIIKNKNNITGVIGRKPVHQIEAGNNSLKVRDLFVDIGANNKENAEKFVSIGDSMVLDQGLIELKNDNFSCRGCDDKIGVFVLLETLKQLAKQKLSIAVEIIASVQEEVGTRGIETAAYLSKADIGIAIDLTPANDYPDAPSDTEIKIGNGPVITRGPHINQKLFNLLKNMAVSKKIPFQIEANGKPYGTDVEPFQRSRGGVITALISIPNRYMHSPSETCNYKDIETTIKLLVETISSITPQSDFNFI